LGGRVKNGNLEGPSGSWGLFDRLVITGSGLGGGTRQGSGGGGLGWRQKKHAKNFFYPPAGG